MNRLQKNPAWLMLLFLGATAALFAVIAPQTLSAALGSIAIQLPQLGILTLAMFVPVISGGLNLAITYIANIGGLLAAVILTQVFQDAGFGAGILAFAAALPAVALIGAHKRLMVPRKDSHTILFKLGSMILLKGEMDWLTRGG